MSTVNVIIDVNNDFAFYNEVREILGVTSNDLPDNTLKIDILLGMAEREIIKKYVPNWSDILNGDDKHAARALRSSVILKLCLNILEIPAIQNLYVAEFRIVDIIMNSDVNIEKLKESLRSLFQSALSMVGVVHSGDWPEFKAIGMTDSFTYSEFYIDNDGNVQQY